MTSNLYSPAFDELENFKRCAERNAPASVDFSERIMNRIQMESDSISPARAYIRKRKSFAIASIAIALMLLSSLAYAATTTDWFIVKDKSGRELMQVNASDGLYPIEQKRIDQILNTVQAQLQPGEGAQVLIGQKNIDDYMKNGWASSSAIASQSITFKKTEDVLSHLTGPMSRLKLPGDNVGGAKLVKVEVVPHFELWITIPPDQWVKATDLETGYPYAYYKIPADGRTKSEHDTLRFTYANEETTYSLAISYGKQVQLSDISPSTDRISKIAGVPIYRFNEATETNLSLIWNEPAADGIVTFTLNRTSSNSDKHLDFAKAVIEATAIGGE
ncbi:unnamed protein product [Aphanomyces euteiches]